MNFLKGSRRDWMEERVAACTGPNSRGEHKNPCFPLLWSMSPRVLDDAPDWLHWYFAKAQATQKDWFVLPPSGDLYAYPGLMPADIQKNFVAATEKDCVLMDTTASVAWEWFGTWGPVENPPLATKNMLEDADGLRRPP